MEASSLSSSGGGGGQGGDPYAEFSSLYSSQLSGIGLPEQLWQKAYTKLTAELFDAGNVVEFAYDDDTTTGVEYKVVAKTNIPKHSDVWLIDHAWTTTWETARKQLREMPQLVQRMATIMGLAEEEDDEDEGDSAGLNKPKTLADKIWSAMWKFNNSYSVGTTDGKTVSCLYVHDEVGSWITHSDTPNFRLAPFYYAGKGIAYSFLWPIEDVEEADDVTRDFLHGVKDNREVRMLPFLDHRAQRLGLLDLIGGVKNEETKEVKVEGEEAVKGLLEGPLVKTVRPSLLRREKESEGVQGVRDEEVVFKVFTPLRLLHEYLQRKEFQMVEDPHDADIWWLYDHFYEWKDLPSHHHSAAESSKVLYVNQFPEEKCLVVKDLLAHTIHGVFGRNLTWFKNTYDMETQAVKFLDHYWDLTTDEKDNTFIIKPWNLSRTQGHVVSNDLGCIIRQMETGPKIAQKYIDNPLLYDGVKFDMRFLVMLKSVAPLELYVHHLFWPRFANIPFTMNDLEEYEKHFTVMNYRGLEYKMLHPDNFVKHMDELYPEHQWQTSLIPKIHKTLRSVFEAAVLHKEGIEACPNSRAVYGVDIMLDDQFEPIVLEVNFCPDFTRAAKTEPTFFNDVFALLFLDETPDRVTKL